MRRSLFVWGTGSFAYVFVATATLLMGDRIVAIIICGLPPIIGSAIMAVLHGQRHGYG